MGYRLRKTTFVSETLLVSKGSPDLLQTFHIDIAESLIDQASILSFLSSFYPFWAVCGALLLQKESSPVCGFHLAVLLLNMFNLLPVVTVLSNSHVWQQWHSNGEQLWWCGKKMGLLESFFHSLLRIS